MPGGGSDVEKRKRGSDRREEERRGQDQERKKGEKKARTYLLAHNRVWPDRRDVMHLKKRQVLISGHIAT